ncbi:MAG: hypothetical protein Q9184_003770 [Pyrenodesmia sp. 2 TL-2023]
MGIPRLAGHLQPYAVTSTLGSEAVDFSDHVFDTSTSPSQIIIDGPGLAYQIYHRLLAHRAISLKGLDAIPSYSEIGAALIAYLDCLRAHGCHISHIYFDGLLPVHKRGTRQARLETSLRDLIKTHDLYPSGFPFPQRASSSFFQPCIQSINALSVEEDLRHSQIGLLFHSQPPLPPCHRSLPAPPFLVPAILDALAQSPYARVTEVVPGEADTYCAHAVYQIGGTILTNDSDLLVYDTGPYVSIAFFKDIDLHYNTAGKSRLQASTFHPSAIAKRLHLPNLHRLAYKIKTEPTISFAEALRRSKVPAKSNASFNTFLEEYTLHPSPSINPREPKPNPKPQLLDPRLSELILQLSSPAPSPSSQIHIYLPLLLDDPTRASAWDPSSPIRHLIYSLLTSHLLSTSPSQENPTSEFSRRGYRILPIPVPRSSATTDAHLWLDLLEKTRDRFPELPCWLRYRVFALAHIYHWHIANDKNPPSRALIVHALTGDVEQRLKWEDVHLDAQVQGLLYSLRMLKQTVAHLDGVGMASRKDGEEHVARLGSLLEDLPNMGALCPSRGELRELWADGGIDVSRLLDFVMYPDADDGGAAVHAQIAVPDTSDMAEQPEQNTAWQTPKKRKGKKKPKHKPSSPETSISTQGTNLYNLLAG